MSLEQTLEQTNDLLKQIIILLQTGASAPAEFGEPDLTPPKKGRSRKEAPAPAEVVAEESATTYWLIEKHRTVYLQAPGMNPPGISGAEVVTKDVFEAKKIEFAAPIIQTSPEPAPAPKPAPTPAPTPVPKPAPQPEPEQKADANISFDDVFALLSKVSKSAKPEHGRDGVMSILRKWLPGDDKPAVSKLASMHDSHAAIAADIRAMLDQPSQPAPAPTSAPAATFDPIA